MAERELALILRQIRRAAATAGAIGDRELLDRFISNRDGASFELLVWRHARLVFGVCQRVLGDVHDAEDAFQAVILILARKANRIRKQTSLACWLYKVAYRAAVTLRAHRARKRSRERSLAGIEHLPGRPAGLGPAERTELRQILDQEINRLPERLRAAVVLCYLEGRTVDEAARALGCPRGTVASRLARARQRLQSRLVRRGLALGAALTAIAESEAACKPLAVAAAFTASLTDVTTGAGPSPAVATLAREVLQAMFLRTLKIPSIVLVTCFGLLLAGGGLFRQLRADAPEAEPPKPEAVIAQAEPARPDELVAVEPPKAKDSPRRVQVIHPEERKAAASNIFRGHLGATESVQIRTQATGLLEKICFKPGMDVKKGDLLFEVASAAYGLDVQKAAANIELLEARRKQSELDLKRTRALEQTRTVTSERVEQLTSQLAADIAAIRGAKVDLERAHLRLAATRIVAPINGTIGRPTLSVGNQVYAEADHPSDLATISVLDPISLTFTMDEASFRRYQQLMSVHEVQGLGGPLDVWLVNEPKFAPGATLESFDNQVDPGTGTIRAYARLPNPDKKLLPGMFARVRIQYDFAHLVIEIPESAVYRVQTNEGDMVYVQVVTKQNLVEKRSVKLGFTDEPNIVVQNLKPNEWVLIKYDPNLEPGAGVEPEPVANPSRPAPDK